MLYDRFELILLFFTYSFAGWCVETAAASLIGKRFRNRGFVSSPFCMMYGVMGLAVTVVFKDLRGSVVLLFLGCSFLCTLIQWCSGLLLEHLGKGKWWDYSNQPLNINGYISVPVSGSLGAAGTLAVLFANDLLVGVYRLLPRSARAALVWALLLVAGLDLLVSWLSILRIGRRLRIRRWNARVRFASDSLAGRIAGYVRGRIARAYPRVLRESMAGAAAAEGTAGQAKESAQVHAIPPLEIFWLFLIGALAGDRVETVFMWLTRGRWMSRSSLIWGTFSVVWGLAIGAGSALLYQDGKRSDRYLFLVGTLLGGTWEYLCSVFTELVFGAVFWDYSHIPFNIAGRINLLYCFFWGIAAVVWIRYVFPPLHRALRFFLAWERGWISAFAILFMAANIVISSAALVRYDERSRGVQAGSKVAVYLDKIYDDSVMMKKYPGAKRRSAAAGVR